TLPGQASGPRITLAGYTIGPSNSQPLRLNGHTWSIRDDYTMIFNARGTHELKIGGDLLWNHDFYEWNTQRFGLLQANGGPVPANIQTLFPVWNDMTTWNLAPLSAITVRWTQSFASCSEISGGCGWSWINRVPYVAGWVQDNWNTTPNLTVHLRL